MWICPICKTKNDTYQCSNCSFDMSKDYMNYRSICQFSEFERKIFKPEMSDNILMESSDTNYIFGKKLQRERITSIYFFNNKKNVGENAWDVSEKQNRSILAWLEFETKYSSYLKLCIAANGNIIANKNCYNLFGDYENLEKISGMQYFQTDQTEDMCGMFNGCKKLKNIDVSHFDTSCVTDMNAMFSFCENLKSIDVSHFNTSHVTSMEDMFYYCENLKSIDVSNFDTQKVENMADMFRFCDELKKIDIKNFNVSSIDENIEDIASLAEYLGLSSHQIQLSYQPKAKQEPIVSGDNTLMMSNDTGYIFGKKIDRGEIKHIYFINSKKDIGENAWDVSEKQDGSIMAWIKNEEDGFLGLSIAANGNITANKNCRKLFAEYENLENIFEMQYFQTNQTEDMFEMFYRCKNLENIDVSYFDTSHVMNMSWMFYGCKKLVNIDVSQFDTNCVTDMSWMFYGCEKLERINVSYFDTSHVTDMKGMFSDCKNLKNTDVSHFSTSKVENMDIYSLEQYIGLSMLKNLEEEKESTDIDIVSDDNILMASSDKDYIFGKKMDRKQIKYIYFMNSKKNIGENAWDVSEKQNGSIMAWLEDEGNGFLGLSIAANGNIMANKNCCHLFFNYKNLKKIFGMQYFRTDQTEDMKGMFAFCSGLEELDVSYFDTKQVKDIDTMFFYCDNLTHLDLSNFKIKQIETEKMKDMFFLCDKLEYLDISGFDERKNDGVFLRELSIPFDADVKR